ncbi:MAG: tRNA lysidine(34) synthetase TilS [Asticcacaulis sp.]
MRVISDDLKSRLVAALDNFPDIVASLSLFPNYLNGSANRPVGVAVSGGGDSVALLLLLWLWGRRPLHVFTVDHGINPMSADWAQGVRDLSERLGLAASVLHWTGEKPSRGVQAAARRARHGLILRLARTADIRVVCLGHNADDAAEAAAMRAEGSSVGDPRLWSPAPLWPEGAGVFYFRPLMAVRRQRLRDWLRVAGVTYVDDPANENPAYLRARVRQQGVVPSAPIPAVNAEESAPYVLPCEPSETREVAGEAPPEGAFFRVATLPPADILSALIVCAGGGEKLPRQAEVVRILDGAGRGVTRFTLCGARIAAAGDGWLICREPGDMMRKGAGPLLCGDIWDGRFRLPSYAFEAEMAYDILPAKGRLTRLPAADQARLKPLPPAVRAALPVLKRGESVRLFPAGELQDLTRNRLRSALGLIGCEADINCPELPVA